MVSYVHSYVLVLPREGLGGPAKHFNALVSMISHPGEEELNSVEISTFPTGHIETANVSKSQSFQYKVNHTSLMLDDSGKFEIHCNIFHCGSSRNASQTPTQMSNFNFSLDTSSRCFRG